MTKISLEYNGHLQCTLTHELSHTLIYTDAPLDIGGQGQGFSPTDLVAAGLASCIATTIGLYAKRKQWNVTGMRMEIEKGMTPAPERRIIRLAVEVWMPCALVNAERQACERVAQSCAVQKSLHPGIEVTLQFYWPSRPA